MLTDVTPTAGQFYGTQIPTMGMNITNITTHIQKPTVSIGDSSFYFLTFAHFCVLMMIEKIHLLSDDVE